MWNRIRNLLAYGVMACVAAVPLAAAEHHGVVKFAGLPLPGATVTLTQGDKKFVAIADAQGVYSFPDVPDGTWTLQVEMQCFTPIKQEVAIAPGAPSPEWEMKMLPLDEIKASAPPPTQPTVPPTPAPSNVTTGAPATAANGAAPPKPSIAAAEEAANGTGKKNNGKGKKAKSNGKPATGAPANASNGFQRADVNATGGGAPAPADSGIGASAAAADPNATASDAMVVNGSVSNGIERRVIGNNRRGPGALYRGDVMAQFQNSYLNARQYSLLGENTPQPAYNNLRFGGSFGGPMYIPHVLKSANGSQFFINYTGMRSRNASNQTATFPTADERRGDFSQAVNLLGQPLTIYDPTTGMPFPGNVIPVNRISPVATKLLSFYPLPGPQSPLGYNYQLALPSVQDFDAVQTRLNRSLDRKNFINGNIGYQRGSGRGTNIFGFTDPSQNSGINASATYRHMFNQRINGSITDNYSRSSNRTIPYFSTLDRNLSQELGIVGNDQSANNYGPPGIGFNSFTGLNDAQQSFTRNQTNSVSGNMLWIHRPHNIQIGGDFRRLQFNTLSQQNGRGGLGFNGTSTEQIVNGVPTPNTGSDMADFLLGMPDTASLAIGNADKYFRTSTYDLYINDDWRVGPSLSLNYGLRWDYTSPVVEKYGRLVNLDVLGFYTNVAPVEGNNPTGPLTHNSYPSSLVKPDKHDFGPRVALAWHPIFGSSLVVRAGYGVYYDTSVYQNLANNMAQQSPFSRTLNLFTAPGAPLNLATVFLTQPNGVTNTFALDPNFRIGYAQNWQISAQRDLPGGNVITVTYFGAKGTRAVQAFAPNTYPIGGASICPGCPSNYTFVTSNGNSTREAVQVQLQRRFHNGISATAAYTFSKSLDDAVLGGRQSGGGSVIAQNWLNLAAERGYSPFDQRHLLTFNMQYTSGVGVKGGTLLSGWRGVALKRWTLLTNMTVGSGKPETPIYGGYTLPGTTISNLRPEYTGQDVYAAPAGRFLNPQAFIAPLPGMFGNAGRNSIIGPNQFSLNATMQRTFEDVIDVQLMANNALNHVTYPSWNANISSSQFGLANQPNGMRTVQLQVRWRF